MPMRIIDSGEELGYIIKKSPIDRVVGEESVWETLGGIRIS